MEREIQLFFSSIPPKTIIGLRTLEDSYNSMNYGEIIGQRIDIVEFRPYYDDGEPCSIEYIPYKDIVSIETNSKETEFLHNLINNKAFIRKKKKRVFKKKNIKYSVLKDLLCKNLAIFHINETYFTGYLLDANNEYIVLQTLDPNYNIDYGISYYPLSSLNEIILHDQNLDIYPYAFENWIMPHNIPNLLKLSKYDFFKIHERDEVLIDLEDVNDIKEGLTSVGYVEKVTHDILSIVQIDDKGIEKSMVNYKLENIVNYGTGGFYLNKINLLYKNNLYKKSFEKNFSRDDENFYSTIKSAKESGTVVSLISDKSENEYFESTGFITKIGDEWIKMKIYDIEEDDWYNYYRRVKDFTDIRINSYIELLVKLIHDSNMNKCI